MTNFTFYIWLIATALVCIVISLLSQFNHDSKDVLKASYLLISFFIFFTISIFIFSKNTIRSSNPYMFTRVFLVSISMKILFLALLVVGCIKFLLIRPKDLVVPLLSSYLLFTILETWVLMKLSKNY